MQYDGINLIVHQKYKTLSEIESQFLWWLLEIRPNTMKSKKQPSL